MHSSRFAILLAAALALAACQKAEEKKSSGPPATLITVTQARAGATFQVISSSGRFHGLTTATTPLGLRTV